MKFLLGGSGEIPKLSYLYNPKEMTKRNSRKYSSGKKCANH